KDNEAGPHNPASFFNRGICIRAYYCNLQTITVSLLLVRKCLCLTIAESGIIPHKLLQASGIE
ncbi:MAG TPA: hypothetical protein PLC35_05665, partial [Methanosarcina vacuolata]|nr:hypothetical protein [Methanosarcina vacuolata]